MNRNRKKIVTIGGGTGSFMLLTGLKKFDINLSAIVSMADDGGSTGVLRDELGVLPPGDVRQCLVALSQSPQIMRDLLNYRFEEGGLAGHSFGNLFLSALEKISGNFLSGVEEAMEILKVKGEVIPVTGDKANLFLELKTGQVLKGENEINHSLFDSQEIEKIYYQPKIKANPKALERIKKADFIVIGPGNLFCSILPNLIIKEIAEAIKKSKARVIYNCNLTNKKGHTEGFGVDDYVRFINQYIGQDRINYVIFNSQKPPEGLIRKYEKQEGKGMLVEYQKKPKQKYELVLNNVISSRIPKFAKSDKISATRAFIRHDSDKLAKVIFEIIKK